LHAMSTNTLKQALANISSRKMVVR
jgi:hypothetical protein